MYDQSVIKIGHLCLASLIKIDQILIKFDQLMLIFDQTLIKSELN